MQQPLTTLLKRLWQHISPRRRGQFALLLGLTVLSSIAEVVSLGAVLPFIGIITQPEQVFASPWMAGVVHALDIKTGSELVMPLSIGFAVAALVAGGLRLLLLRVSVRLSNATGADLSIDVYHKTIYDFLSLKKVLEEAEFKNIRKWDWRNVDHGHIDDYSQAYIPHMDKDNGVLISLNVECEK